MSTVHTAEGEDRSAYQPVASWAGLDFGWAKATEGTTYTDPSFAGNWRNLRAQVAHRGAYHFFHPGLPIDGQVDLFMNTVIRQGLEPGDMLAIDAEIAVGMDGTMLMSPFRAGRSALLQPDAGGRAVIQPGVTYPHRLFRRSLPRKILDLLPASLPGSSAVQFLQGVKAAVRDTLGGNYCPVLCYTYLAFIPQLTACTSYPLWIAAYSPWAPASVDPWPGWIMWQFAGGGGQYGSDQDAFNGTPDTMNAWIATYTGQKPSPPVPAWETAMINALPTLKEGDKDTADQAEFVRRVQWMTAGLATLRTIPAAVGLPADGTFGAKTTAAVKGVQKAYGLTQDGIVGPSTWGVLYTGAPA